jgi:hypothetical protein
MPAADDSAVSRFLQWLQDSPVATEVREGRWWYPGLEILHILGFVILVGAAAMFDLRLLGATKSLPVRDTARHLLRWSQASILLVVPAGLLLFISNAVETFNNPAFRLKMLLLALAAINALVFHLYSSRDIDRWNTKVKAPAPARINAVLSLLLWTAVIVCGRMIAYV